MRFLIQLMKIAFICTCIIGSSVFAVDPEVQEYTTQVHLLSRTQDLSKTTLVEVEHSNILSADITGIYYLVPYRNRRLKWGKTISLGLSNFNPLNYEPNFLASDFKDVYSTSFPSLMELQFVLKRNFILGSIGAELGAGLYNKTSVNDAVDSRIELIPVRFGINVNFDNLFFEPYLVPYASGGVYTMIFKENTSSVSHGGNTQVAPYFSVGVALQLNWLDREAARVSYMDSGMENTFLYIEGRMFMVSQNASDPDFSTGLNWGAGMRVEF
ncbi:MAG: hypothetical protein K1X29_00960 [Bdellovibrionales bacterium]|nr:hypothetical protein [Bdellovibrionales bacterium]